MNPGSAEMIAWQWIIEAGWDSLNRAEDDLLTTDDFRQVKSYMEKILEDLEERHG